MSKLVLMFVLLDFCRFTSTLIQHQTNCLQLFITRDST